MIPVLVPDMPTADEVLPYLRRIDSGRWYTNGGPLVRELQDRLARDVVRAPCAVVTNGTTALELALRALRLPRGAGVLVPAVTFAATGLAVVNAGLVPVLCDVRPDTWQMDPDVALWAMRHVPRVRAALPVAAFGLPVPIGAWEDVTDHLHVVVDAAGAIYGQCTQAARMVFAYSLHATKALGCGEGGAVAAHDQALVARVAAAANFGPDGGNAKLDEYRAAVALAALDRPATHWRADLSRWYGAHLPPSVELQAGANQRHRTLLPVLLPDDGPGALVVADALRREGIETRQWYTPFLSARPDFRRWPMAGPLPVAAALQRRLLGLPWHHMLTEQHVRAVCAALAHALSVEPAL